MVMVVLHSAYRYIHQTSIANAAASTMTVAIMGALAEQGANVSCCTSRIFPGSDGKVFAPFAVWRREIWEARLAARALSLDI
jgi:hypothetical protein